MDPFRFPCGLDRERAPAAAGLGGVRIGEVETATDEGSAEVKLHAVDVKQTLGIANHTKAVAIWRFVVVGLVVVKDVGGGDEIHRVAHPTTAAGSHAHAQDLISALIVAEPCQLLHCSGCNQNAFAVACGVGRRVRGGAGHRRTVRCPHFMEPDS